MRKQVVIARSSPYSWEYTLKIPGSIRRWIRQPPKNEHWHEQVSSEIETLKRTLTRRGWTVSIVE
jgi:hypothetical protein